MSDFFIPLVASPPITDGSGGGGGLPEVSADDNGDVLTVVNGAWGKAAPSGGGGVLIVNAVVDFTDPSSPVVLSVDKTSEEVYTAAQSGHVEAHVTGFPDEVARVLPLQNTSIGDDTYDVCFVTVSTTGHASQLEMFGDENYFDVFQLNID